MRQCSHSGCVEVAAATLTYVYDDATVVLGPLAAQADPHAYDLCAHHAQSFTAPRGWQVVRLANDFVPAEPSDDDLDALAHVVRQASKRPHDGARFISHTRTGSSAPSASPSSVHQYGHLRVYEGSNTDES